MLLRLLENISASPKARKFARELGVDINKVIGSERKGRVIENDIKFYVSTLEEWCIATLKEFDIKSFTVKGRTGIWIKNSSGESKIGAIGVRVSRWVTYHGISINVNPDLKSYDGIIACGLENYSITSLHQIGIKIEMKDFDQKLIQTAKKFF